MADVERIYWFSGTGNSLYAAKELAASLANPKLIRITEQAPEQAVGGPGVKIGFVFPSYFSNLPRAVRAFIGKLEIKPDTYIFALVTMGSFGQGSIAALASLLQEKGLQLGYGRGILMPANYILKYNPTDAGQSGAAMEKKSGQLQKIAGEIRQGSKLVKKLPITAGNLYKDIASLDAQFWAADACTNCGLCQSICPVANIRLENGKPLWLHNCEHCIACISWCPAQAIEYGEITRQRRRYRNQRIDVQELRR